MFNNTGKNSSLLWLAGILLLAAMIIYVLFDNFVFHKDIRRQAAIESGQRYEISLKTGEITGKYKPEEKPAAAPLDQEPQSVPEDSDSEEDTDSQPVSQEIRQEEDPLAWMGRDFIGPRLPDDAIKALLSSDLISNIPTVKSVSIEGNTKPVVVIIIKDVGLNPDLTRQVMELPKEINIGFSAYTASLDEWVKKVRDVGHEVVLNIPMESADSGINKPGPYSLLAQNTPEENLTRLKAVLNLTSGYSALYSENNEIFSRSIGIGPLIDALKKENKYFVYGGDSANNNVIDYAKSIDYPLLVNDLVLDDDISSAAVTKKFNELEEIATERGYVVAMAHAYPATISMLEAWLQTAANKNLAVSPVSLLLGKSISK